MRGFLTYIRKHIKELDYILIISFLLLGILGVIMVYSASMVPASKGSLTGGVPIESNHF
ncbi:cell division protein FtsW, partial [Staphylococcus xylosus]